MEQSEQGTPTRSDPAGFGIPELDAADRRLGALVHELNRAIADGREGEATRRLMDQILTEAIGHFEREERVLLECGYPTPKGHAGLHLQIRAELEQAIRALRGVKAHALWAAYGLLVEQLFVEHIREEAVKFRNRLRSSPHSDSQGT